MGMGEFVTTLQSLNSEAQKILAKYEFKKAATLPLLHLAQDKVGYVTPEVEAWVAGHTQMPVIHVRGVVTFYSMYHKKPAGRTHVRFCTGTSCVLRGSEKLLDYTKKKLGIGNNEVTKDGRVSLEEAECLCACEHAPMMQVGDDYVLDLTEKKIDEVLGRLK